MIVSLLELIYEKRRPTERILEGFNSGVLLGEPKVEYYHQCSEMKSKQGAR